MEIERDESAEKLRYIFALKLCFLTLGTEFQRLEHGPIFRHFHPFQFPLSNSSALSAIKSNLPRKPNFSADPMRRVISLIRFSKRTTATSAKFIDVNVSVFRARATRSYPDTNVLGGTSVEERVSRIRARIAVRATAVDLTHR